MRRAVSLLLLLGVGCAYHTHNPPPTVVTPPAQPVVVPVRPLVIPVRPWIDPYEPHRPR